MSFEIIENKVVIDFDIDSTQVSKSGKTTVLATSNGFKWVDILMGCQFGGTGRPPHKIIGDTHDII